MFQPRLLEKLLILFLPQSCVHVNGSIDNSRIYSVDPDSSIRHLQGHSPSEHVQGSLTHTVSERAGQGSDSRHTGDVHNVTSSEEEMWHHALGQQEGGPGVHIHDPVIVLGTQGFYRSWHQDPCRVHHDIYPTVVVHSLLHCLDTLFLYTKVLGHHHDLYSSSLPTIYGHTLQCRHIPGHQGKLTA